MSYKYANCKKANWKSFFPLDFMALPDGALTIHRCHAVGWKK